MTFIMGLKQQKHLEKRTWQILNCEDDVNCGIIAFCDKGSFLTGNGLLLQRKMQEEVEEIRKNLRLELDIQRLKQEEELMALRVSSPMHSTNLHHFIVIHRGVDIMSLDCCPILTSP
jgi:(p)ppGpp synthase/HD superfamily hydrolase